MENCLSIFFKKYDIDTSATFLVALSGGADSMALLDLCRQASLNIIALHCNFHLRAAESDEDQNFVTSYCRTHHISLHVAEFDTLEYVKIHNVSIEMAARELRYAWFKEMQHKLHASYLVVGHHADDLAETILINWCRGTALKGLIGIQPVNNSIIRPLLTFSRKDIMEYIAKYKIPYRDDSTNATDAYIRNKIRHQVIPILKEINPSLLDTVGHNSQILSDINKIYDAALQEQLHTCCIEKSGILSIAIAKVTAMPAPFTLLFTLLKPYGFSKGQIDDILHSARSESGRYFYSPSHTLVRERNDWQLYPTLKDPFNYRIESTGTFQYPDFTLSIETAPVSKFREIEITPNIALLDADRVLFPLIVRPWRIGDYFYPMAKTSFRKKVSDFYKDLKFTEYKKQTTPLLSDGQAILWIMGERIDDRFKITEESRTILLIRFNRR